MCSFFSLNSSHSNLTNTIVATATPTRILALPVDMFDDMFDRDPDFARRILELESRHLQQLVSSPNYLVPNN
jgi:CRP-like cAMP-binding protein